MSARRLLSLAVQGAVAREGIASDRRQPFRPALWTVNFRIDSSSVVTSVMRAISRQIVMNVFDPLHRPNRAPRFRRIQWISTGRKRSTPIT